jgi:hypothetical protein
MKREGERKGQERAKAVCSVDPTGVLPSSTRRKRPEGGREERHTHRQTDRPEWMSNKSVYLPTSPSPPLDVCVMSTLSVYDSEEEDRVILLVGGVEAPLLLVQLRSLHSDVGGVHNADAVGELTTQRGVCQPLLLLRGRPPSDVVG